MNAAELIQRQLEAYNAQDLDAFCATYADDCVIADLNGAVSQAGKAAIRARYAKTFSDFPRNRAWVVHRMALGDVVIDHEKGERSPEGPFFEALVVYTVKNGLIARVDFVK
ncbi:MAG: nuclear transport factor 2 family protein [Hyphomonadaceae bacterium]|nr:nuclear transport factor 2 family protein [Hyphomonadaceae bacterium]